MAIEPTEKHLETRTCEKCKEMFITPIDSDYTVCDRDHDE